MNGVKSGVISGVISRNEQGGSNYGPTFAGQEWSTMEQGGSIFKEGGDA